MDPTPLTQALNQAVRDVNDYRSMGDLTPFLKILVQEFTTGTFQISHWDNKSLLKTLNGLLVNLDFQGLSNLSHVLFEQWEIDHLGVDNREIFLKYFQSSKSHHEKVGKIFDGLSSLKPFMNDSEGEMAPVNLYHHWLKKVPVDAFWGISSLIRLFSQVPFFHPSTFPAISQQLDSGKIISGALLGWKESKSETISQSLWSFIGPIRGTTTTGLTANAAWLQHIIHTTPDNMNWVIKQWGDSSWVNHENKLLLRWVGEFAQSGDLTRLWEFFEEYGSWKSFHELLNNLAELEQNGYLGEALNRVSQFRDVKIQRMAEVGILWVSSGEFRELIDLLREIVPRNP